MCFTSGSLTHIVIDGRVDDLVSRNVAVGLCRLCPAELSDSWTDDIEGQPTRFSGHYGKMPQQPLVSLNLALRQVVPNKLALTWGVNCIVT